MSAAGRPISSVFNAALELLYQGAGLLPAADEVGSTRTHTHTHTRTHTHIHIHARTHTHIHTTIPPDIQLARACAHHSEQLHALHGMPTTLVYFTQAHTYVHRVSYMYTHVPIVMYAVVNVIGILAAGAHLTHPCAAVPHTARQVPEMSVDDIDLCMEGRADEADALESIFEELFHREDTAWKITSTLSPNNPGYVVAAALLLLLLLPRLYCWAEIVTQLSSSEYH